MRIRRGNVLLAGCIFLLGLLVGCAGLEYAPKRQILYYHKELPAADRAVEAARKAGKDKECPEDFRAAEKMKDEAYEIYWSCRTAEGIAKANDAASMANALCPKKAEVPKPAPVVEPPPPPPPPPPEPTPAPAPPPPPPPAEKPVKETISLKIEFDTAKSDIKPKYNDELAKVAAYMKKYPETTVTIEGHTDNVGGEKYNQKLSENRAESVKKSLVEKLGADASRISTKGYGLSKPIADNKTKEGKQKNRRIEAIFR